MVNVGGLSVHNICRTRSIMYENNRKLLLKEEISKIKSKTGNEQRYYFAWKRQKPFARGPIYYKYTLKFV